MESNPGQSHPDPVEALLQRASNTDLSPVQRGIALHEFYEALKRRDPKVTWEVACKRAGVGGRYRRSLCNLRLLPPEIIEMLEGGQFSVTHGIELERLQGHREQQVELARRACRTGNATHYGLSVAQLRQLATKALGHPATLTKRIQRSQRELEGILRSDMGDEEKCHLLEIAHRIEEKVEPIECS